MRRLCNGGYQPPFYGDFGAIGLAHNLLSAMIDNHIHHGNELNFDVRRIAWKRVVDMNDRALRQITVALEELETDIRVKTVSTSWWLPKSWRSSAWPPRSRI